MYSVLFLKDKVTVLEKEFSTLQEAEDFVSGNAADQTYKFLIKDMDTNLGMDEDELDDSESLESDQWDAMFPDEESMEGFDVNDFWSED
jgi:hypothetical protein